jgi:cation diffusion facilitator CzcD-associated flavoprotein CzcO
MFLKSQGFASDLSSPDRKHSLEAFCEASGLPYASYGLPVALEIFVSYGLWFRQELVPDLEETLATEIFREKGHFGINFANGEHCAARNVVIATGVEHFAVVPDELAELPASICTHSSAHDDLGVFRDRRVLVLGAGQSALESAALLHECGAKVQLVARRKKLSWNG